jgi:hypothetical protein
MPAENESVFARLSGDDVAADEPVTSDDTVTSWLTTRTSDEAAPAAPLPMPSAGTPAPAPPPAMPTPDPSAGTQPDPAAPADPADPVGSAAPADLAAPADPATPADPAAPADPAGSANPEDPTGSASPADPAEPGDPAAPEDLADSADPEGQAEPADPNAPADEGDTADPATQELAATMVAPATKPDGWTVDPYQLRAFTDAVVRARSYLDTVKAKADRMQDAELTPQLGTSPVGQQLAKKFDDRLNSADGLRAKLVEAMKRMDDFVASAEKAARTYEGHDQDTAAEFDRQAATTNGQPGR